MKIDLGFKSPYYGAPTVASDDKEDGDEPEKQTCYPSLSVEGKAASSLSKKLDAGDTFTAQVTFKVIAVSDRVPSRQQFGSPYDGRNTMDLEVISMESGALVKEEDEEETGDDAIDSFLEEKGLAQKK